MPQQSPFKPTITDKEPHLIKSKNLIWLGHSTQFWDGEDRSSFNGTRNLIEFAKKHDLFTVATIAPAMLSNSNFFPLHYFTQNETDLIIESVAGGHRLKMPNLENIFFAGGNLNRCLCEGIRDVAISVYQNSTKDLNIYLVTDSIYAAYNPFSPILEEKVALDFVKNFFVPAFKCPLQNWSRPLEKRIKMPEVSMDVFFGKNYLSSYNLEPNTKTETTPTNRKFNVHFITSSELKNLTRF